MRAKGIKKEKKEKIPRKGRMKLRERFKKGKDSIKSSYHRVKKQIGKSIKLEIITMVIVCLFASVLVGNIIFNWADNANIGKHTYMEYGQEEEEIKAYLQDKVEVINKLGQNTIKNEVPTITIDELRNQNREYLIDNLYRNLNRIRLENKQGYQEDFYFNEEKYYDSNTETTTAIEEEPIEAPNPQGESTTIANTDKVAEVFTEKEEINSNSTANESNISIPKKNNKSFLKEKLNTNHFYTTREECTSIVDLMLATPIISQLEIDTILDEAISLKRANTEKIRIAMIEEKIQNIRGDTYILDGKGTVVAKKGNEYITHINVVDAINGAKTENLDGSQILKVSNVYPVVLGKDIYYLLNETLVEGRITYGRSDIPMVMGFLAGSILFIFGIFRMVKPKLYYIQYVSHSLREIATGNLNYYVEVKGEDELADLAADINFMENQLREQQEAQRQVEKTKNELITNVAHDLRTPLTSIIGYIGLLKENKYENQEEFDNYLAIAYNKSEKLKVLIEDLFEYTKLTNEGTVLSKRSISMTNLVLQLVQELLPLAEEKEITIETNTEAPHPIVSVDAGKLTRAVENLLENAIKYSDPKEQIVVDIKNKKDLIILSIKNKTDMGQGDLEKLFERFYRADTSRNSTTGGSGLGLAIVKSIVELHGGKIWAELKDGYIYFYLQLCYEENGYNE